MAVRAKLDNLREERPDGPRSVAEDRFHRRAKLAKSLVIFGDLEQRIIPKAASPRLGKQDSSPANVLRLGSNRTLRIAQRGMADIMGAPPFQRNAGEPGQQTGIVARVGCALAAEAGRIDPRSSAERIHRQ